jgi:hypothetical protein
MSHSLNPNSMQLPPGSNPIVHRGKVVIYRVFDVAEEIDLSRLESVLTESSVESRVKVDRKHRPSVVVRNAPVRLRLGDVQIRIGEKAVTCEGFATAMDYGVLSIALHLTIPPGTSWTTLIELAASINASAGSQDEIDAVCRRKSREVTEQIRTALKNPSEWDVSEDYVLWFLEEVEGIEKAADLVARADIPALLLAERTDTLAPPSRDGILENTFQYATDDLVVIDWNSAIVYEPSGQMENADIIEFALTHLLEVRYYDDVLDRQLAQIYDAVDERRRSSWKGRFSSLAHEANTRFLEISEIMERVDNSIKVVGDYYLAVVFRAAIRRFRVLDWQQSITRKMNSLARVSELLQGEMNVKRSHMLELIVILLIAFEILSAFLKHG